MFKMSSAGCNAGCQSLAPFTDHIVNNFLVQTVPFLLDMAFYAVFNKKKQPRNE